jgi:two-component system cell cycle sensor histidine kinase/response regulator CckA
MSGRFIESDMAPDGFVVRRRPFFVPLTALFLVAFAVIFLTGISSHTGQGQVIFALTLMVVIGSLSWFTIAYTRRKHDLVLLAEYQNAIFASAFRVRAQFSLIVQADGSVTYLDPGLQQLYPEMDYRKLKQMDQFYTLAQLPQEAQDDLNIGFTDRQSAQTRVEMTLPSGRKMEMMLSLYPLNRPAGYFLVQGREYVVRPNAAIAPPLPTKISQAVAPAAAEQTPALDYYVASAPIPTAVVTSEGIVEQCNESFRVITDRTRQRRGGWSFTETVAEDKRTEVENLLTHLAKQEGSAGEVLEIQLGAEAQNASLYTAKIGRGGADEPTLILVHLIDLTAQKNLEEKYAHSQKMQAVGQLAGGVAHDFNNLLTAMIGFCDLLLVRHPAGDESFADIMQIKQNANRAANLVRQLLAFSRRQTLQPKSLVMTDVLAELSNLIRRLIGENIELKISHGRDVSHVKADQGQLEQVLINLAVNARDAMQGGGELKITTSVVTVESKWDLDSHLIPPSEEEAIEPGEYVCVAVEDTGEGIPADKITKIFEPFFSTKEVGAGTGLGLSTVYGIVKQTGGYIYVASEEGRGTTFCLYLPHHREEIRSKTHSAEKERMDDLTGRGTVMLVEDEAPVRSFAARALRNKGYEVLEADCGEAALDIMEKHGDELHVIVSDVIMPGMNGPEMIKQILPKYPDVKVIFISGYAEDAFTDSFGEEGSFNFLPKPFTLKQLAKTIKDVMEGNGV